MGAAVVAPRASLKRLLIMALIGWLGVASASCAATAVKPGCAPGSTAPIVAQCEVEVAHGLALPSDCDARIDEWQAGCLR